MAFPLLLAFIFLIGLFLMAYLLVCSIDNQKDLSMTEKIALVFEVYRYAVCFVMIIVFGLLAYFVVGGMITSPQAMAELVGPGVGVLLSAVLFLAHWRMKNPSLPKA